MRNKLTWILLILLAVGGIVGSYALSEKFRTDAWDVWQAKADQSARWLSGTVLGWLDESYAPLSGLAILFENSREVTEVEFLGATDALEARATSFFLDAKAAARPRAGGEGWSVEFSNDPLGPLSPDMPLSRHPVILEAIQVAADNPDQIMLGPPFSSEEGSRYSPAALAIRDVHGPLVVIGLVNYDAIVRGLFDIHKLDGLQLQIQGRFKEMGGPGPQREVIGKALPEPLHTVTTPTVRAPISCLAISAITGAAPVPVPPPSPAVTKTMSAPRTASLSSSRLSSAASRPTRGSAPAPRPFGQSWT